MNSFLESEPIVDLEEAEVPTAKRWSLREFAENDVFRLMVESVESVAFFLLTPEGLVASWNPGGARIEGYREEEILGRHFSVLYLAEEQAAGVPARELETAKVHGRCETEGWRVRKDGTRLLANVSIAALLGDDGELIGYSNVTRDLTETRGAQEKLRLSYERLNAVMDSTSDGVLQISPEWMILYGNRKAADSLPDYRLGGDLWDCFPELLGTNVERTLRGSMRDRVNAVWENHYAPYNLWYRCRSFPVEEGISIFFSDVTSEKMLQNQLALEQVLREKRMEALSHMAGGLAHEINNPLAIIHARASDLCSAAEGDVPVPPHEVREICGSIVHTSDRAIRVLRALQGFAREANTDPMLLTPPLEILEQCMDLLEDRFCRHRVELRAAFEDDLPDVRCREVQIRQIVTNLVNNALDAIQQRDHGDRWVALSAKAAGDALEIEVMDSGPGVETKFRAHLMDPFFTAKVRGLGMGVGLSLSRAIAQEHGGELVLVETSEHTTFRLTLPLTKGDEMSDEPLGDWIESPGGRELC